MKARLKPGICYMSGLSRRRSEKNMICIVTGIDGIELRFIEIAVNEFKIDPKKVVIEEQEDRRRKVYFYHSRIARQLVEIQSREDRLFRTPNELSSSYVAGIVDSSGRFSKNGIYIDNLTPQDEVMLANLGIHTRDARVSNISALAFLVKGKSIMLGRKDLAQ
jgi:hypothetical protein